MGEVQKISEIPLDSLLQQVQGMHSSGRRLAQICCTRLASDHEVNYSFDSGLEAAESAQEPRFVTLRVRLPLENPVLPSISCFYWSAFLYENEMHDLFGVSVKGMAVDFHGRLYTLAVPAPYAAKDPTDAP